MAEKTPRKKPELPQPRPDIVLPADSGITAPGSQVILPAPSSLTQAPRKES